MSKSNFETLFSDIRFQKVKKLNRIITSNSVCLLKQQAKFLELQFILHYVRLSFEHSLRD